MPRNLLDTLSVRLQAPLREGSADYESLAIGAFAGIIKSILIAEDKSDLLALCFQPLSDSIDKVCFMIRMLLLRVKTVRYKITK